jgi:hypothetical protein
VDTDPKRLGKRLSNEGHGFSRVSMSLRLTQGDENLGEVVFDCAVKRSARLTALQAAEKLVPLKGMAFRPYITAVQ